MRWKKLKRKNMQINNDGTMTVLTTLMSYCLKKVVAAILSSIRVGCPPKFLLVRIITEQPYAGVGMRRLMGVFGLGRFGWFARFGLLRFFDLHERIRRCCLCDCTCEEVVTAGCAGCGVFGLPPSTC